MYSQQGKEPQVKQHKPWLDHHDIEIIFLNAIAICIVLLVIVAADVFM